MTLHTLGPLREQEALHLDFRRVSDEASYQRNEATVDQREGFLVE